MPAWRCATRSFQAVAPAPGTSSLDLGQHDDYPDVALDAGRAICSPATSTRAILVCGSGAGVSVAASKLPGIRASVLP